MAIKSILQGTPEWLAMRREFVGSSDCAAILGVSPWTTIGQLLDCKLGLRPQQEDNEYMKYGRETEPEARRAFEEFKGVSVYPKVVQGLEFQLASLDGISMDGQTIVEIKCPGAKDHAIALKGQIPEKYIPQLQHILSVTGAKEIFYWSYKDGLGTMVALARDEDYILRLVAKEKAFYDLMMEGRAKIKEHEEYLDELKNRAYGLLDGACDTAGLFSGHRGAAPFGESASEKRDEEGDRESE